MKFYEVPETKCMMHILVYSVGTKATRRKAAVCHDSFSNLGFGPSLSGASGSSVVGRFAACVGL